MQIWPGRRFPLGATYEGTGTNFAIFSEVATRVELCLFDADGVEERIDLAEVDAHRVARLPARSASRANGTGTGSMVPTIRLRGIGATRPSCCSTRTPGRSTATCVWNEAVYGYEWDAHE